MGLLNPLQAPADTVWRTPTLTGGWANYGSGFTPARYRRLANGQIEVQGLLAGGTTTQGTVLLNLPAGYRPNATYMVSTLANNLVARVDLQTTGDLTVTICPSNVFLSINFCFYADA